MSRVRQTLARRLPRLRRAYQAFKADPAIARKPDTAGAVVSAPLLPEVLGRRTAYAHWGEDLVVSFLLNEKRNGFYVDVGCYHPTLYSNTALLFEAGWRGINIDPNPFMIEQFKAARPNDVNLNLAISDMASSEIEFFVFSDWGSSNTASAEFAADVSKNQNVPIQRTLRVPSETLRNIFERYCADQVVDFLNIDVEDLDLKVLGSNDWQKWRPTVIVIEDFEFNLSDPGRSGIYRLMTASSYRMVARLLYSSVFVSEESGIRLYRRD